jgi:hypothetical protein
MQRRYNSKVANRRLYLLSNRVRYEKSSAIWAMFFELFLSDHYGRRAGMATTGFGA